APAEKPRLVAVVVLEEPQGQYYAAEVAAPLFARIVSQALGMLRVVPKEQIVPATVVAASGPPLRFAEGVVPVGLSGTRPIREPAPAPEPGRTPDALGLSAREAIALFGKLGEPVVLKGSGFVVAQSPAPGWALDARVPMTLTLGESGPAAARSGRGRGENTSPTVR